MFTPEKRSEVMSRVRSKNTKPELAVRRALHGMGYRFRLHRKDLPGKPDVVLPKHRVTVFVHGCFWHQHPGCPKATMPKNNAAFWREKLKWNVERDERNRKRLRGAGWRTVVIWECEVGGAARHARRLSGTFLVGHPPLGRTAIALPMVEVEILCPNSSSKASRCSSRVRSSLASRCFGNQLRSIAPFLEGLPGIGLGSTSPVSRRLFIQRFMVGIDTEKVLATSSLGVPASTAESTLSLRSFEYGFMPGG